MKKVLRWMFCASLAAIGGCGGSETYTLYRSSVILVDARMHVATFDAADGEIYNHENCDHAAALFKKLPGIATNFWCEKGRYRK